MHLNKTSAYTLLCVLGGVTTAAQVSQKLPNVNLRSIQRALARLNQAGLLNKQGSNNNPTYSPYYPAVLYQNISSKLLEDDNRPGTVFNHQLISWLDGLKGHQLDDLFGGRVAGSTKKMSSKELEHLTIELSWKSSALEGNTYTLLDTQLLISQGVKAKNRTEFETQMILNHKNAIAFIMKNPNLFGRRVKLSAVEELHRLIGFNLGIGAGIRGKTVGVTASNYRPLDNSHQLKDNATIILRIINRASNPLAKTLLALSLIPYLQLFEDGNKRTGRLLANALLIGSGGRGFSLRRTDAKDLALAYLAFYEFNSLRVLSQILKEELVP